ncbi:ferrochelatase [Legionella waltersii]|uniref:Ferrochelatase n=1 Tax=Legionella waltersii TaxID=66969 RepID=A0A0W1A2F7_9GAMM|nr:ferrochelatase [Legionella waltersii]KTD75533.1 ferrochelatase [Legionella waltersii]SNU98533.1 ferrochelatase [Legionella waltersii]
MRQGLLLINLGTPNNAKYSDVASYLLEFLTDKRVIDLPFIIRYALVFFLILPFRTKQSTHAYQSIWTDKGSPLLLHSQTICRLLQESLNHEYIVALGMRYGVPSIKSAINELRGCSSITVLPLFPQYSSAATGSAIEEALHQLSQFEVIPSIKIIQHFYQHPAYIKAQAKAIEPYLSKERHLLFSYHGIPERQIIKSGCSQVCTDRCPPITDANHKCYKAQCHQTSFLLAQALQLDISQYSSSFQSRLGKTPWIKPYTDELMKELAKRGVKKLVVACPSFVTDCLETIEEIGIRAKELWLSLGGEEFVLVPCLNESSDWIDALVNII